MEFMSGYEAPKQERFETCTSLEDLISAISEAGVVRNSSGREYQAEEIISVIDEIKGNIESGAYDKHGTANKDGGNETFQSDLLQITSTEGIRDTAEKYLSIAFFNHVQNKA